MTISGTNLSVLPRSILAASALAFTDNGDGTLTAVSPGGDPSTVDVTVVTLGGTTPTSPADQFTYEAPPNVTGISPAAGPEAGGTSVTIYGTGLTSATRSRIRRHAGDELYGQSRTDRSRPSVPAYGFADTFDVQVVTPAGTSPSSSADQFTYSADAQRQRPQCFIRKSRRRRLREHLRLESRGRDRGRLRRQSGHDHRRIGQRNRRRQPRGRRRPTVDVTVVTPGGRSATVGAGPVQLLPGRANRHRLEPAVGAAAGGDDSDDHRHRPGQRDRKSISAASRARLSLVRTLPRRSRPPFRRGHAGHRGRDRDHSRRHVGDFVGRSIHGRRRAGSHRARYDRQDPRRAEPT